MPPIINAQGLTKSYGAAPLFEELAFTISEGERIALIGPNGSGKSTLLRLLAGLETPDAGEVATRRNTRISFVAQESAFPTGATVLNVLEEALRDSAVPVGEHAGSIAENLGRAGFADSSLIASSLSGGWKKRLAIASALAQQPDVLLLDEPTNHLDLPGIEWLEQVIRSASFACVVVSHDRYFLENVAGHVTELNRVYPEGQLRVRGKYSHFLEKKEEFLHAQTKQQEALENLVHNEIDWLRRGPKARTSKSKARIDKAHGLIAELGDVNARTKKQSANIDFVATDRKTKRLVDLEGISCALGGRTLFSDLDFVVTARMRLGLVGPNGSGKTSLLRLIRGELAPTTGNIKRADLLRIVYFDQNRVLDPTQTLRQALAPHGDSVVYQDRVVHVASWASRFLFSGEQLNQPLERLSGGERARVLIAKLMLEPADVLLLDEPTNDLDIPTLEVLEASLLEFPGALVLVTHDRFLLDRVSNTVLGFDGLGGIEHFASYSQWEKWLASQQSAQSSSSRMPNPERVPGAKGGKEIKKKLSYREALEYDALESRISAAEALVEAHQHALADPAVASDSARLLALQAQLEEAQLAVDRLYARWSELEAKLA